MVQMIGVLVLAAGLPHMFSTFKRSGIAPIFDTAHSMSQVVRALHLRARSIEPSGN
jgi:hypothetical protein